LVYYVERNAVVILDVFSKKTQMTPKGTIDVPEAIEAVPAGV
jgi:phage-related protein